jgi:uncharacterized membrane protein HdeD (DUF308 family)
MTPQSLAFLAGIHALGNGCFQTAMAVKMRKEIGCLILTALAGVVSLSVGIFFLTHFNQPARPTTQALSGFELFSGITWIVFAFRLRS